MKTNFVSKIILLLVIISGIACSSSKDEDPAPTPPTVYKIGDLYQVEGIKGIVYKVSDDGTRGMIVSLDETTTEWAINALSSEVVGANDEYDGLKNMAVIKSINEWQKSFPAFAWCDAKNGEKISGWFLPAYFQLVDLYDAYALNTVYFNECLTKNGGVPIVATSIENQDYWSSTEENTVFAATYEFLADRSDFPFKSSAAKVRAVKAF